MGYWLRSVRIVCLLAGATLSSLAISSARACEIAVLLAVDVSTSVDDGEYALQTAGHAAAFRDPGVIRAILDRDGVRVALMHWSGEYYQKMQVGWTLLDSEAAIADFADRIGAVAREPFLLETAIGEALRVGGASLGGAADCGKLVIDVSGDGANNDGAPPEPMRDALAASGVTVNAVVIDHGMGAIDAEPDPVTYYRLSVIGGRGAFLVVADGFEDYGRAFRLKLMRELQDADVALNTAPSSLPRHHIHERPPD